VIEHRSAGRRRMNSDLAGALVQKALPPVVEVKEMPRRVR
jgi:hypothetical protein